MCTAVFGGGNGQVGYGAAVFVGWNGMAVIVYAYGPFAGGVAKTNMKMAAVCMGDDGSNAAWLIYALAGQDDNIVVDIDRRPAL